MADPGSVSQGLGTLLGELAAFGFAIGLSPLHIGLLLLLLLEVCKGCCSCRLLLWLWLPMCRG